MEAKMRPIFCFVLILALIMGCTVTKSDMEKTGLFNGDISKLMENYNFIVPHKTTREDLEDLNFNLNALNVRQVPGTEAIKLLFGSNVFQGAIDSPEDLDRLLAELNQYSLIIIPHKDITSEEDRFYFSTKRKHSTGISISIFIVLKNNLVVYRAKDIVKIDRDEAEHAFGEGVFKIISKLRDAPKSIKGISD